MSLQEFETWPCNVHKQAETLSPTVVKYSHVSQMFRVILKEIISQISGFRLQTKIVHNAIKTVNCMTSFVIKVFFVCAGSGSIDIPVICMLVSGGASMLEVSRAVNIRHCLNPFSHYGSCIP